MTVTVNDRRLSAPGNGVATLFNGPKVFDATHLSVYLVDDATGVATLQVNPTNYSVGRLGLTPSQVTMVTAPATGKTVLMLRTVPLTQSMRFTNQGAFLPELHEDALDIAAQRDQQLNDMLARALRLSDTSPSSASTVLPEPQGSYLLGWNSAKSALQNYSMPDVSTGTWAPGYAGAVATRTIADTFRDTLSVKDFGAVGNGTTDDTAAINAAISYAGTIGGATIFFPKGTYKVSSTITIAVNGISLRGAGMWNTIITRSTDYGDTFVFTGNDATGVVGQNMGISHMSIKSTALTTSGSHIRMNGLARFNCSDIFIGDGFIGMKFDGVTAAYYARIYLVMTNIYGGSSVGRRFWQFGDAAATYAHPHSGDVFCTDFNIRGNTAGSVIEFGLNIESSDGLWFENGHVGNTSSCNIRINATTSNGLGLVFFNGVMSDEGLDRGLYFAGNTSLGINIFFNNCIFKGGSTGVGRGMSMEDTCTFYKVHFTNCQFTEYGLEGVRISSPNFRQWDFTGCTINGNSRNASGAQPGFRILTTCGYGRITGGRLGGQNANPALSIQSYGIESGSGVVNLLVTGVDLTQNVTGGWNGTGSTTTKVVNCVVDDASDVIASAATLNVGPTTDTFLVTGTTTINNLQTGVPKWRRVQLVFQGALTVADGVGNLRLAGNFVTTADDTLSLTFDGTNWVETARSVN